MADGRSRKHQSVEDEVEDADTSFFTDAVIIVSLILNDFSEALHDDVSDSIRLSEVGKKERLSSRRQSHATEDVDRSEAVLR